MTEKSGCKLRVIWLWFSVIFSNFTPSRLLTQLLTGLIVIVLNLPFAFAKQVNIEHFNTDASRVEQLIDTNLTLALKRLIVYQPLVSELSIKQQLLYYKLLAEIYVEQGQYTQGKTTANQGLNIAKQLASPSIKITELLYIRGFAFESLGHIPDAREDYKKGLEVAESLHNKVFIAYGLINLGAIYYLSDDYERSLVVLNDAFNIAEQTSDEELKGSVNSELGILYSYLQQDKQSMAYYQQAYAHFKKAGKLHAALNSLHNIAINHNSNERYQQAIVVFKTIIAESKNTSSDSEILYGVYSGMAWAHLEQEESNPEAAYQYLMQAKQFIDFTEQHSVLVQFYINQAFILFELKQYDKALVSIDKAEAMLAEQSQLSSLQKHSIISLHNLRANTLFEQQQFEQAYQLKTQVLLDIAAMDDKEDTRSVEQVRLHLESEQADARNKALQDQNLLHEAELTQARIANEEENIYLLLSALAALAFAWLLVKLLQGQKKLKIASSVDPLTGVANRRSLIHQGNKSLALACQKEFAYSVLMIDIDHFKQINDNLGHRQGDSVLVEISKLGQIMMRKTDIFGRYGGEEFIVLLPKTSLAQAKIIAERLRVAIAEITWPMTSLEKVTVSIGVASKQAHEKGDLLSLINAADERLYQAKAQGRDRVCG